jgi:hypothetical protein
MRWKSPEDYDRTIVGRQWRDRFFNRRLAIAAALLIVTTLSVFVIAHYFAWGTFPD